MVHCPLERGDIFRSCPKSGANCGSAFRNCMNPSCFGGARPAVPRIKHRPRRGRGFSQHQRASGKGGGRRWTFGRSNLMVVKHDETRGMIIAWLPRQKTTPPGTRRCDGAIETCFIAAWHPGLEIGVLPIRVEGCTEL